MHSHERLLVATSDIIGHVTIGLVIYGILCVVSLNQPFVSHGF